MVRWSPCDDVTTKSFVGKIFYFKAPNRLERTNTPENFYRLADHLTSAAMKFCPVILKKICCYLRECHCRMAAQYLQSTQVTLHCSNGFIFWVKMVKFFWGQWPGIYLKKATRFAIEIYSVGFKMLRKGESSREPVWVAVVRWSQCNDVTTKRFLGELFYFKAPNHLELTLQIIFDMWQTIWPVQVWIFVL